MSSSKQSVRTVDVYGMPLRRSPRLMEKTRASIPQTPVPVPVPELTPQQQHIKITYALKEIENARPEPSAPRNEHAAHIKKYLNLCEQMKHKNCKIRVITQMFWDLASDCQSLLEIVKFRDVVVEKMLEIDNELYVTSTPYSREFYWAAWDLKRKIEILRGKPHSILFKGYDYFDS